MFLKNASLAFLFLVLLQTISKINSSALNENDVPKYLKFIKGNMMESVKPCDNFYTHACGNWKKNRMIPTVLQGHSATKYAELIFGKLISDFAKNKTSESSTEMKIKQFYASCMDMRNQFQQIQQTIEDFIKEKSPNDNETSQMDWIKLNFVFDQWGINTFIKYEMNYAKKEMQIKYPTHSWFPKIIESMAALLTGKENEKAVLFRNLPELQKLHQNLTLLTGQNSNEIENGITLEELKRKSGINWHHFFNEISNATNFNLTEWKFSYYLGNTSNEFNDLLSAIDNKILLNYVIFNVLSDYLNMFMNEIYQPLEKVCIKNIDRYFLTAILPYLIEKTFADEWKNDIEKIFEQIKIVFLAYIDRTIWFDEITKSTIKTKLNEMKIIIGDFNDESKNRTKLDEIYQNVNITNNYGQNLLNLKRKKVADLKMNKIPKLSFSWPTYLHDENTFSIPLWYSQEPFYNITYSNLMKFNGMNFVIAFEMVENLIFQNQHLWSEDSVKNFNKYFEFLEIKLNDLIKSNQMKNETQALKKLITDNIAAEIAYDAFREASKASSYSEPLEYLNANSDRFHFLQFAETMCTGDMSFNQAKKSIQFYHSLGPIRVNIITKNMPKFAEIYECSTKE